MTAEQIIQDINNKVFHPVYLLTGEEAYYIDMVSKHIEKNVLNEMEREFNQLIVYGKDTETQSIIDSAKKYPMMANYQVIVVKEAQHLRRIEDLEKYLDNPLKTTILVLCYKYKKLDGRTAFYKKLKKTGLIFKSEKIRDYKLAEWINEYIKDKKIRITPKSAQLLADNLGNDLSKIVKEVDKLLINLKDDKEITPALIEKHIGISKDFNIFELQDAVGTKNVLKANKIAHYFEKNQKEHPFVVTISILYGFFLKVIMYSQLKDKSSRSVGAALGINPFFTKDYATAAKNYDLKKLVSIVSLLREYDLKSKGVGNNNTSTDGGALLKELIFKIMH